MLLGKGMEIVSIFRAKECQQPLLEQHLQRTGLVSPLILPLSFLFKCVLIHFVSFFTLDKTHQPLLNACWAAVP